MDDKRRRAQNNTHVGELEVDLTFLPELSDSLSLLIIFTMFILGIIFWWSTVIHCSAVPPPCLSYTYSMSVISQNNFQQSPVASVVCGIHSACRWREQQFFQLRKSERGQRTTSSCALPCSSNNNWNDFTCIRFQVYRGLVAGEIIFLLCFNEFRPRSR